MSRPTCPYCFRPYALRSVPFRCVNVPDRCAHAPDETLAREWGMAFSVGRVIPAGFRLAPATRVACDRCGHDSVIRICPSCHQQLPSELESLDDQVIAIVGAADAGKSHYIAALIRRLGEVASALGLALTSSSDLTSSRYATDFERHLRNLRTIPPTASGAALEATVRVPLVYALKPSRGGRGIHLVFFDMAGEDLGSRERLNLVSRYLFTARGIVFLVDPLQLGGVRSKLEEDALPGRNEQVRASLARLIDVVRAGRGGRGRIEVPLAVTLTKLDAIDGLLGPWSTLRRDPRHEGGVDARDRHNVDRELRAQLHEWGEGWLGQEADGAFEQVRFFAASALGGAPGADGRLAHLPLPRRVEDPLLWMLELEAPSRNYRGMIELIGRGDPARSAVRRPPPVRCTHGDRRPDLAPCRDRRRPPACSARRPRLGGRTARAPSEALPGRRVVAGGRSGGGGNAGAHDGGVALTTAQVGPLLMVTVEAVRRAMEVEGGAS